MNINKRLENHNGNLVFFVGSLDISDLSPGYALIAFSSSGVRGTYNIASSAYSSGTSGISNYVIISGFANAKGYSTLTLTSEQNSNYIVYGIKSDGTLALVAYKRGSGTAGRSLVANVSDYDYVFFATWFYSGTAVTARLT